MFVFYCICLYHHHLAIMNYEQAFLLYVFFSFRNILVSVFTSLFGVHIYTTIYLYIVLNQTNKDSIHPQKLLLFLHWLKHYPTEILAATYWGCDLKTWRKYFFEILLVLQLVLNTVCFFFSISFLLFFSLLFYFTCFKFLRSPMNHYFLPYFLLY